MTDNDKQPLDTTEGKIDEAVDETFPASDPPSIGGSTGPGERKDTPPKS